MSGNCCYMICSLNDADYQYIKDRYGSLFKPREIDEFDQGVCSLFRYVPELILPHRVVADVSAGGPDKIEKSGIDAEKLRDFSQLFMSSESRNLFYELSHLSFRSCDMIKMLSGDSAPMLVLFYAIGYSSAIRIPGSFGHMLIHRDDLIEMTVAVRVALSVIDKLAWDRARRVISTCSAGLPSMDQDEEIAAVFSALPVAFNVASERGTHLLAFGFWFG